MLLNLLERAVNKTLLTVSSFFADLLYAEAYSRKNGKMQNLSAELKIIFIFLAVSAVVLLKNPFFSAALFLLSLLLVYSSKIPIKDHIKRCAPIPAFSFVVYIPLAVENAMLGVEFFLRILASVSFLLLLISTTKIEDIVKAMEKFGMPKKFAGIVVITYRYSSLFVRELVKLAIARRCRVVKNDYKFVYRTQISALGTLYIRALERGERVYLAMKARGYGACCRGKER